MKSLAMIIATCVACSGPATQSSPPADPARGTGGGDTGGTGAGSAQPPPADPATGCPAIQLKSPDSVPAGSPARVSAILAGGPTSLVYNWKLSSGKITSGQHTAELVVDTHGLAGATITATLEISGLATTCATTTATAAILVGPAS